MMQATRPGDSSDSFRYELVIVQSYKEESEFQNKINSVIKDSVLLQE